MPREQDFVGNGWRFPLAVNGRGGIALSRQEQDIDEAIRIILTTAIGERRMRPEFGSRLYELIFASLNATTLGLAEQYTREALYMWEPRIEVTGVEARIDPDSEARLLIDIQYTVRATNDERNLVHPFYIIHPET